jgi:hypothetical protein
VPRYLVKRTFPGGLALTADEAGARMIGWVVAGNTELGATWLHSYVADDKETTFCIWEAPSPEAIRKASRLSGLPVQAITRVTVLDPHFYR